MTTQEKETAHELYRAAFAPRPELDAAERARLKRLVIVCDWLTLLAGVWLIGAPYTLGYSGAVRGSDGFWNDAVVGAVIGLAALIRLGRPLAAVPVRLASVLLGGWLVVAPLTLGFGGAGAPRAVLDDLVVGMLVLLSATVALRSIAVARRFG